MLGSRLREGSCSSGLIRRFTWRVGRLSTTISRLINTLKGILTRVVILIKLCGGYLLSPPDPPRMVEV